MLANADLPPQHMKACKKISKENYFTVFSLPLLQFYNFNTENVFVPKHSVKKQVATLLPTCPFTWCSKDLISPPQFLGM